MERNKVEFDIDDIINKLLQAKSFKPNKLVSLSESEIKWICIKAKEILMEQPVFLELDSPINICGIYFMF